jgi:hypothetical protein
VEAQPAPLAQEFRPRNHSDLVLGIAEEPLHDTRLDDVRRLPEAIRVGGARKPTGRGRARLHRRARPRGREALEANGSAAAQLRAAEGSVSLDVRA